MFFSLRHVRYQNPINSLLFRKSIIRCLLQLPSYANPSACKTKSKGNNPETPAQCVTFKEIKGYGQSKEKAEYKNSPEELRWTTEKAVTTKNACYPRDNQAYRRIFMKIKRIQRVITTSYAVGESSLQGPGLQRLHCPPPRHRLLPQRDGHLFPNLRPHPLQSRLSNLSVQSRHAVRVLSLLNVLWTSIRRIPD